MNVNKVEYSGKTLIDLTSDTVTPDSLLSGATAHNSAGEKISGNVDLSEYLKNNGNASNTTVSFTEATNMAELATDENMSTLFGKLKLTVRNVINVLKLLGSTDISSIGDGTVTGAVSTLNSNFESKANKIKCVENTLSFNNKGIADLDIGLLSIHIIYMESDSGDAFIPFVNAGKWRVLKFDPFTFSTSSTATTISCKIYYIDN